MTGLFYWNGEGDLCAVPKQSLCLPALLPPGVDGSCGEPVTDFSCVTGGCYAFIL